MRPTYAAFRALDIVNAQIAIISPSYINVVITVTRVGVPHVVIVAEVVNRPCVEVPIGIAVPRLPLIVSAVSGDHPVAGQGRIRLNLDVLHINSLPALCHHVEFHYPVDVVVIGCQS